MYSTKTFACTADALLAKSGSTSMGAGAGNHLPVGLYSGYVFRAALKFAFDWTGVTKIVNANLYLRTSDRAHLAFGSSPQIAAYRVTSAWSEGTYSCESGYSTGNAVTFNDVTGVLYNTSGGLSTAENTWVV